MQAVMMMQEKRKSPRKKTFLGGTLEFSGTSTMSCLVRNLSAAGARVEFHNTSAMSCRLTLVIPQKDMRQEARIIWRNFGAAGVEFVDAAA